MTDKADGRYPGNIVSAYVTEDPYEAGQHVLKLDVDLEDGGAVTCKQPLKDSEAKKRGEVCKALGIPFPFKSTDLAGLRGKGIDVNLKTSPKGNQNAYVATMREERVLTPEEIDAMGHDDALPF